jgi:predicted DNA-binding transcriptional regulator YafY
MEEISRKKDRTARLLKVQMLLWQNPKGLWIREIAKKCSVSTKTIYRDLTTLESELDIPIWEDGSKRGLGEGYFLPPINLTREEAMNIFLAIRLMQNLTYSYNPSIISTFQKLDTIVPEPLRRYIQSTIEYLEKEPKNENNLSNFNRITQAWLSQHPIRMFYKGINYSSPKEYIIEPYFIEPSINAHSFYVIGYCRNNKTLQSYNIDLIIGNVTIEADTYQIPDSFNPISYLSASLDIHFEEELITAKLRFDKSISNKIMSTIWHPSQVLTLLDNGSVMLTLRVRDNIDFRSWILGWRDNVEVVEPKILRNQISNIASSIAQKNCPYAN